MKALVEKEKASKKKTLAGARRESATETQQRREKGARK
jgi:hypothetical protein